MKRTPQHKSSAEVTSSFQTLDAVEVSEYYVISYKSLSNLRGRQVMSLEVILITKCEKYYSNYIYRQMDKMVNQEWCIQLARASVSRPDIWRKGYIHI